MPSRYPGALTQDWEPVVLNRRKPKATEAKSAKAVNAAIRAGAGAAVETVQKQDAGTNKKPAPVPARKLDEAMEPVGLERVAAEVRSTIRRARVAKGMSQAELAKRISERPQVVQDYESGKAVPSHAVLAKMEKVLEVKLRGKIK